MKYIQFYWYELFKKKKKELVGKGLKKYILKWTEFYCSWYRKMRVTKTFLQQPVYIFILKLLGVSLLIWLVYIRESDATLIACLSVYCPSELFKGCKKYKEREWNKRKWNDRALDNGILLIHEPFGYVSWRIN